jgi:hypothetical protein
VKTRDIYILSALKLHYHISHGGVFQVHHSLSKFLSMPPVRRPEDGDEESPGRGKDTFDGASE